MSRIARLLASGVLGGGYTGPLDLVPGAAAAYSVARKLRSAYAGALVRLRRASDDVEQDFYATASGALDTTAVATFLAATTGYIVTLYDQSGNGRNATQATAANQPLYVASGTGSKPTVRNQPTDSLKASNFTAIAQPTTVFVVGAISGNSTFLSDGGTENGRAAIFAGGGGKISVYAGTTLESALTVPLAVSLLTVLFSGASSVVRCNGSEEITGNAGAHGQDGVTLGAIYTGTNPTLGDYSEYILYPADKTASFSLLEANIGNFYQLLFF